MTLGCEPVLFARRHAERARRASRIERVLEGAGFSAVARFGALHEAMCAHIRPGVAEHEPRVP